MENRSLDRFITAQEREFARALTEISYGRKQTHWMWYIFPQIQGLGHSDAAKFYAIKGLQEAADYLIHPTLGPRLIKISRELMNHKDRSVEEIFGTPDDLKLRSCMTLFAAVPFADPIFQEVLDEFFDGEKDQKTQSILGLAASDLREL